MNSKAMAAINHMSENDSELQHALLEEDSSK
jgi:hypothetical protein